MATVQEIKGSRKEWEDNKFRYGERLYVATTQADAGIPSLGDGFTDAAGGAEANTAIDSRIATDRQDNPEVIPGIWFFRILYKAVKAYVADS